MMNKILKIVRSILIYLNMFPRHLWKITNKKPKFFDTVVNSVHPLPFPTTNGISNTHNNPRPQVDCFATNLSTFSRAGQDVLSDEINY